MPALTPMQAAYWVGRRSARPLAAVSAHLYAEFDAPSLDPERLQGALNRLRVIHPMLALRVTAEGEQAVADAPLTLSVDDLRHLSAGALGEQLEAKRALWTHRQLDLTCGPAAAFGLTLLPDHGCRLHVDTDMLAVDPASFRIVMETLAQLYERPDTTREDAPTFFAWLEHLNRDQELARQRELDRRWWRARLAAVPPAPVLPIRAGAASPRSGRLAAWLHADQRRALQRAARDRHVTTSTLMLGLFALTLGAATRSARFRLNVPTFWRAPVLRGVDGIVGEFSNVLLVGVDLDACESAAAVCRQLGDQLRELLSHCAYPGVSVLRDLSRHHGAMQLSPVVFTAGLDLPGGELFSQRVARVFGKLSWVVSQGPQVALDAQVAALDGGVLINWDIRFDALPSAWIQALFDAYVALARRVAAHAGVLDAPLRDQLVAPTDAADALTTRGGDTERMLVALVGRLSRDRRARSDADLRTLGLGDAALADLLGFVNQYLPETGLSLADVAEHRTPAKLARVLRERSHDASERIARALLDALQIPES